ncbi:L,D-transpeptidase family protein [Aliihoeflea aestuarii]|uniref:L,D-transpeptidase family protein n=1 Tax=Aliihoeflea aestuarii TaxID=453840 RepID=UPI002093A1F6|nr:L,D-transpeptidase family protein [Aliihoeflea aestuarii]MCO6390308.1 L,D-transpeptidase family protein [Aliihoeflea aestuarii]
MNADRRRKALALASTTLIAALTVSDASAQGLLQRLFQSSQHNGPVTQQATPQPAPIEQQVRRAGPPPQAPRVTGPQYYTYKTDALSKVDFTAINIAPAALASPGIDHGTVGATRRSATDDPARAVSVDGDSLEEAVEKVLAIDSGSKPEMRWRSYSRPSGEPAPDIAGTNPKLEIDVRRTAASSPTLADALDDLATYELYAESAVGDAIVAHYSKTPDFIWTTDAAVNDEARAVIRELADADAYGLNPGDYAVAMPTGQDAAALARFEMALSARVLRYARDVHAGRVDPNRISGYHDFELKTVDYAGILESLGSGDDARETLRALHPQNEFYKAMQVELEELRASEENSIVIAPGTLIRPGQTNTELPKIVALIEKEADQAFLAEHGPAIERNRASEIYTDDLVPVVRAAQAKRNLQVDGIVGPRTVTAFAGETKASRIEKVKLAMEQLRWLPSDLGQRYVLLNTPSAKATYVEHGAEKFSMRTVVGSKGTQTYFFQDEISYVEFHPYWGVPRSIIVNTHLPRLYRDPSYFDRNGFEVTDRNGRQLSSSAINWTRYGANIPYNVRQRPGPNNALGELKIMFPNKHAIYMHDTPDKSLFGRDNRALSNGCVRLEDPRLMAAAVLGWDRDQVDTRLAGQHGRNNLDVKFPVYVAYFTAWPDADGKMGYYPDVYDRDLKTREAMGRIETARAPSI